MFDCQQSLLHSQTCGSVCTLHVYIPEVKLRGKDGISGGVVFAKETIVLALNPVSFAA